MGRWGETTNGSSTCYTYAVHTSYTSLSSRCCKTYNKRGTPSGSLQLSTPYNQSPHPFESECMAAGCPADVGSQAMGCTATDSHKMTDHFTGVRWWKNIQQDGDTSGCVAQLSFAGTRERGYLGTSAYCGSVSNGGELNCKTESAKAVLNSDNRYEASVRCSGLGYKMTDCNAYSQAIVSQCSFQSSYMFGGHISYGGDMQIDGVCRATGNSDQTIAQAICCKIV